MNGRSAGSAEADPPLPIVLAREEAFVVGRMTVTTAALRVSVGDWSQRLEPRAMQVLVLLAKAAPRVVGRDEINARVWGGRVIGADAINRAVQMLRRVASDCPVPAPFAIETLPRVGYRLIAGEVPPATGAPSGDPAVPRADTVSSAEPTTGFGSPESARWSHRIGRTVPIAVLTLLVGVVAWWTLVGPEPAAATWRIAGSTTREDLPAGARDVALSPTGDRLAYRGQDTAGHDRIFVRAIAAVGSGSLATPIGIEARHPAWSPDGTTLAFVGYDAGRPCSLYVVRPGAAARAAGSCETAREPELAWSSDGRSLLFGDSPGENAVLRIGAVRLADGRRTVLGSPPGDSAGDSLPVPLHSDIVFRRQFGWADEGWIERAAAGSERLLWRRRGVAGSVAAVLPDGSVAIAWTSAGASGLDVVDVRGRRTALPIALDPVISMSAAGKHLLLATDRSESALIRAVGATSGPAPLASTRGKITGPVVLPDGRIRFPVTSAGVARILEGDDFARVQPWGTYTAARIVGLATSSDARWTTALATTAKGQEVVLFDTAGRPRFRWNPHARKVSPAAWGDDDRRLIVPVLDGAGWRLVALDPFGASAPRDLGLPGYAVVLNHGSALYAVRAGETTGIRELWRLDGRVRRLPIDLTLFDIVNWTPVAAGVWLPDRSDRDHPRLVLRSAETGGIVRSVAAPGLARAASGLAADARGPIYIQATHDSPEYTSVTMTTEPD